MASGDESYRPPDWAKLAREQRAKNRRLLGSMAARNVRPLPDSPAERPENPTLAHIKEMAESAAEFFRNEGIPNTVVFGRNLREDTPRRKPRYEKVPVWILRYGDSMPVRYSGEPAMSGWSGTVTDIYRANGVALGLDGKLYRLSGSENSAKFVEPISDDYLLGGPGMLHGTSASDLSRNNKTLLLKSWENLIARGMVA